MKKQILRNLALYINPLFWVGVLVTIMAEIVLAGIEAGKAVIKAFKDKL